MRGSRSRGRAAPDPGRWLRRLLCVAGVVGAVAAFRERKLATNRRRFGLPG